MNPFESLPFKEMSDALEERLGVPNGYFLTIVKEPTDWEFITKMGALVEAGATQIIVQALRREVLRKQLSFLPLLGDRNSKHAYIKAMGLLMSPSLLFLEKFAELRNLVVHNSKNINFNLESYLHELNAENKNLLKRLEKAFHFSYEEKISKKDKDKFTVYYKKNLKFRARLGMSISLSMMLMEVYLNDIGIDFNKAEKELKRSLEID